MKTPSQRASGRVCYTHRMGIFRPTRVSPEETSAIVRGKLDWILEVCTPREVWLFGSAARGELTEASDIDLALVFATGDEISFAREALHRRARSDLWPQDVVFFLKEDIERRASIGGLPMLIMREGVRIYPEDRE